MSSSKVKNKDGKPELQIVISFCKPEIAQKIYKDRWQIETSFYAKHSVMQSRTKKASVNQSLPSFTLQYQFV